MKKSEQKIDMDLFAVEKKTQVENFVIGQLKDGTIVINTVDNVCLGIYNFGEEPAITLANLLSHVDIDWFKTALYHVCLNLLLAHQNMIVDQKFLEEVAVSYTTLHERVEKALNATGLETEDDKKTDEQILDEVLEKDELGNSLNKIIKDS